MPWYTFSGIYLIVWSALLVHCLFRREFYPIFGRRWGTKALWLLTFVFLNPLLTLIYLVFGFLLNPPKTKADEAGRNLRAVSTGLGSAVAIASIGVVFVFFELPLSQPKRSESIILRKESTGLRSPQGVLMTATQHDVKFRAHIGTINTKNSIQTLSSTSAESGAMVSMRNILIICQSPHDLLDRSMREFQKSLIQLPYVGQVAYYPYGTWPEPGGLIPDVFIIVNMPVVTEKSFIRSRYLKAVVKLTVSSSIFAGTSDSDQCQLLEVVRFDIESQLDHEGQMFGIESSQAKYKLAAEDISSELVGSISKQFENLLDKYDRMPKSSVVLCGTYHEPPELPFLKSEDVQQLISGYGLLKNNHTVWRFVEKRDINKALMAYRDELKALGWGQDNLGEEYLRMKKENEHICIFHQRRRDTSAGAIFLNEPEKITSETTLIADYESDFTDNQMRKAMDALLDSDVGIKTLLVFEKYFRTPVQLERVRSIIEQSPVQTLDEYLILARYWINHGQIDKGRMSLLRARAMQRTEKIPDIRAEEIKDLAEKLGGESLAKIPVAEEIFQQIGFINAEQSKKPFEIEKSINEPVLFYQRLSDGDLETFALRVVRSHESSNLAPYHLLTVESQEGSKSSSENSGKVTTDGIWRVETSIDALTSRGKSIRLQVKSLGGEKFLFTVIPHHDML